jgi:hypothetical protein
MVNGAEALLSETAEAPFLRFNTNAEENRPSEMTVTDVQEQDAWESRKAWNGVFDDVDGEEGVADTSVPCRRLRRVGRAGRAGRATERAPVQN